MKPRAQSRVRWFYFISHVVQRRFEWEDVYLLPDMKGWGGDSLWLTVDAFGRPEDYDPDFRRKLEAKMGAARYFLDRKRLDMWVREEFLTRKRLLYWVTVALKDLGLECKELVEGTAEMFEGTNQHARGLAEAQRVFTQIESGVEHPDPPNEREAGSSRSARPRKGRGT